jgi:DNA modification methylase
MASRAERKTRRQEKISFQLLGLDRLKPNPANPRKHGRAQVQALARSIEAFGFNAPVLIDKNKQIIAGHGRYEAAKLLKLEQIPVISLEHLSEVQARAYMLADNKLTDRSSWNEEALALHLKELTDIALDFEIEAIGFEPPEIDIRIQSLDTTPEDEADNFEVAAGPAVSKPGDLWLLDSHRLYCGSALDSAAYNAVLDGQKAAAVFTDPPYNVKINGHASGKGKITHPEFPMASGEMSEAEFTNFLHQVLGHLSASCHDGALIYTCMDWRHIGELLTAARGAGLEHLNLCVWAKTNGGMGALYRSRHELVFVHKNGQGPYLNNVQLGRFGRNRSNVWNYPGANSFSRKKGRPRLDLHPTAKPIALVSDAVLDCTERGDIVLDAFIGSGTTILAAARTGRRCYGIELNPRYVDTAIKRWQEFTGREALNDEGQTFNKVAIERRGDQ